MLLKLTNVGCFINGQCASSFMYADDLILLSNSLHELQLMLNICCAELEKLGLSLNENKSFLLRFGSKWANNVIDVRTSKGVIPQVTCGRYLGIDFSAGPKLAINVARQKSKFYASFNSIYSHLGKFNNPLVSLHLTNSISVPCLTYGMDALELSKTVIRELEHPWSRVFMKIFNTFNMSVIHECQNFCGYTSLENVIKRKQDIFLNKIRRSTCTLLKIVYYKTL